MPPPFSVQVHRGHGWHCRLAWAALLGSAGLAVLPAARADNAAATPIAAAPAASAARAAPPALPALLPPFSPAVMARYPDPPVRYAVPSLVPGRIDPSSAAELATWLADTAAAAPPGTRIERVVAGQSQQGGDILALRFSRGPGRPLVLLIGQQHGDEPAGAEALMVLARELAQERLGAVLDKLDVLVVPRVNVDGAEWANRVMANGSDLNRDHLLLRSPEARAIASLVRQQRPVVVVDSHEFTVAGRYMTKFNAVQRYDLLLQYATVANLPTALTTASEAWFRQPVLAALATEGHSTHWYYTNPTTPGDKRLSMGGVQPDLGRNVYGLRHAVSLLLETRGASLGPWHLARRMHSHLVALRTVLQQAATHAADLLALQAQADAEVVAAACRGQAVVLAATTPERREVLMLDPETGADKPVQVDWDSALTLNVQRTRARPCGYWLAADQQRAVATLVALGVQVQRLTQPVPLHTETWVVKARGEGARPDVRGQVADGEQTMLHLMVDLQAEPQPMAAPAGSYYVGLDQPLANLAIAALEPDTPNSYVANRVINSVDAARRVMKPLPR